MSFNSLSFLLFLLAAAILYYIFPAKARTFWVLLAGYSFYALYNWRLLPLLIGYSVIIYVSGFLLDRYKKKIVTAGVIVLALLPLLFYKYGGSGFSLVLPMGLSYFTFKSVGYLVDVYKGKISPEKDFLALSAFISFFPEMLIGPIDRASNLLVQLKNNTAKADWKGIQRGLLILFGGYFEKMVVADRLGVIVDTVYSNLYSYEGFVVLLAVILYSLQIYFDFAGCTYMALGVGRIFGFSLPENFRQPYFAVSVADFWRRWHISLTSWLRDYIYIPLGGNRKGTFRKYLHIMIVFFVSGLWHGTGITFFIWGGLNGAFQILGALSAKIRTRFYQAAHICEDSALCIFWKRLWTFIWMSIAWVFFRSSNLAEAFLVFRKIGRFWNPWILFDGTLYTLGLSQKNLYLMLLLLLLMFLADYARERQFSLSAWAAERGFITKCLITYILIFAVIIWGIYGTSYDAGSFIYMQF